MKPWVVITRDGSDVPPLSERLLARIELLPYPVLQLRPFYDPRGWAELLEHQEHLGLIVFTSRHAPEPFRQQAQHHGRLEALASLPVAAVGETTAAACVKAGFQVMLAGSAGGIALAETIAAQFHSPTGVAFPCGREHREETVVHLRQAGFQVLPLVVYAMEPTPLAQLPALPASSPTAVVVTSPRTARLYWQATAGRFAQVTHFAWGSTTAEELRRLGLEPRVLLKPTAASLEEALWQTL
ncbi:MAG: uroporphyrinogen-III synthase [Thermoanaerobaculum sp.]|nr:uroporphyrinogen-III synthase [Thermoanaerobaculum sp.]